MNETFTQINRLKYYLKYIGPFGYYYHFGEKLTTFYDSTETLPLDNPLPVSPNHVGHNSPNTFIMYVCLYNKILIRKTYHFPWKAMAVALLGEIIH